MKKFKGSLPKLFLEFSSVTSGNVGSALIAFLINIVLIRKFTPEEFGLFSIALLVFNIFSILADFGINVSFIRFFSKFLKEDRKKSRELLVLTYFTKLLTGAILFLLLFFLSPIIAKFLFHSNRLIYLLRWASAGIVCYTIWTFTLSILQAEQNFRFFSILKILYDFLKFTGILLIICFNFFNLNSAFVIYIIVSFLGFLYGSLLVGTRTKIEKVDYRKYLKLIIDFSKWILISTVSFTLFSRLDLIMLGVMRTPEEVGFYSTAFKLISVITIVIASIKQVLLPRVSQFTSLKEINDFIKMSLKYTVLLSCLIIPFIFLSKYLIVWIFTEKYINSITVFKILSVAFIISLIIEPLFLIAYSLNKPEHLAINDVLQLVINFLLNLLLIPLYGINGAAVATLISRILMSIFIGFYIKYMTRPQIVEKLI